MSFAIARSAAVFAALSIAVGCTGVIDGDDTLGQNEAELRRAIVPAKELMITDPSVIESPLETTFDAARPSGTSPAGAWSFGRLVHNMLPRESRDDARAASKLVFGLFAQWEVSEQPNAFVSAAPARSRIRDEVVEPWKAESGCTGADADCVLDMGKAPFRLIAIAYRPDLRKLATDDERGFGGEGRFVFQLRSKTATETVATTKKMTVIFEYSLPIETNLQTLLWGYRWHALGALPFGGFYNFALRQITNDFSGPGADRHRPNGNALNQLRTNEVRLVFPTPGTLSKRWELREFHLHEEGLVMAPVAQEPSRDFDVAPRGTRSTELGDFLNANSDAVLASKHTIPSAWLGNSSLVGSGFPAWGTPTDSAGNVVPEPVRHAFAINTCAGCHRHETNTKSFLHLTDRRALDPADANDAANLPPAPTVDSERQTVLSLFLQAEIAPPSATLPEGGARYADFAKLLLMKPWSLLPKPGLHACAGH